jgi:hypothetical protein
MSSEIQYRDDRSARTSADLVVIEYVGGPYADRREVIRDEVPPAAILIPAESGVYRQSARCADDGALRYAWVTSEGA